MALLSSLLLHLCLGGAAWAQAVPELDAQLYRVPIDAERTLWTDDAGLAPDHHLRAKLYFVYTNDPLVYRYDDAPDQELRLLSDVLQANALGSWSFKRVRVGVDLPVYLLSKSALTEGGTGLGDIALDFKGTILSRQEGAPVGVALGTRFGLPTSTVATPLGNAGLTWTLQAIADYEAGPVLLAANLGTIVNPEVPGGATAWSDQLLYRLGAGLAIDPDGDFGLSLDLAGRMSYANGPGSPGANPAELLFGGWSRFSQDWVLRGGVGTGLNAGIGAPDARLILGFGYEPPAFLDADGDGITDRLDGCRLEPEDLDGWQDSDGCPDPSVSVTGTVVDPRGRPVAEAVVRLQTESGVREYSSPFRLDLHPGPWAVTVQARDHGDYAGLITVPKGESFNTMLTVEPLFGAVIVEVVDPEGKPLDALFQVDGGSPAPITDGRGVAELNRGEHEILVRAEGYKPGRLPVSVVAGESVTLSLVLEPSRATVTRERVTIADKIFFDVNKASIKAESFGLLDEVAQVLLDYPEIAGLRIEGHTDQRGPADANRRLSQARAESVRAYLVDKGVEAGRLTAEGFGEDRPLDPADNRAAWDQNRRVEFMVTEWVDTVRAP